MTQRYVTRLNERAVLAVWGEDARTFLQGLVSNDVRRIAPDRAIWAAFLTPQGKYLHDFFMAEDGAGRLLLDTEAARLPDLKKRLSLYRLRSKVEIAEAPDSAVHALWGEGTAPALGLGGEAGSARATPEGAVFLDPRLAEAGARWIGPAGVTASGFDSAAPEAYDIHRLGLGLPDGSRDMFPDKAILLENGFDELHGVDWDKGCYMGQELTARTRYRSLIKKRLVPVSIEGAIPEPGAIIRAGEAEAGEMRSARGAAGLALIRLDLLAENAPLTVGATRLVARKPIWAGF